MSTWSAPSEADVLTEFNAGESLAIRTAQQSVDSNIPRILARVVAEIREDIRSGGYALDPDPTTIPLGLHGDAIAVARWKLLIAIPKLLTLQTKERKQENDAAKAKFKQIAAQERAVEPPEETEGMPPGRAGSWNSEGKLIMRTHPVPRPSLQFPANPDHYANPDAPLDQ
jgi:hypothetical protein